MEKHISELKSDLSGLKSDFSKLEADINGSRNVNSKLFERLGTFERRCYANEQYSRRCKCFAEKDLESSLRRN